MKNDIPLIPPEETMWQKYSPHFELPLASATSIFLHGVVIGVLLISGLASFFSLNAEATKPTRIDVVMIEGGGSGFESLGGEPGLPGLPNAGGPTRTENVTPFLEQPETPERPMPRLPDDPLPQLGLPLIEDGPAASTGDLVLQLQKLAEDAERHAKDVTPKVAQPVTPGNKESRKPGIAGTSNPKGAGGLGGTGGGPGAGVKFGPGTGKGGPGGRPVTKQQIYALRWRFDLAGDGKEHVRKLAAIGVNVGVIDFKGNFFQITDLIGRPVKLNPAPLPNLQEVVGWTNDKPQSIQPLARELGLPFVPRAIVMMLPKDREESMAAEEARFAKEQGREFKTIRATWFDFRQRGAAYEPVGKRIE